MQPAMSTTVKKNRSRWVMLVCGLMAMAVAASAYAHAAVLWCYVEDNKVYVEAFFMGGKKVQHGKIYVVDKEGKKLLEGVTNEKGLFNFDPPFKDDLKVVLRLDSGHGTEFDLLKQDFIDAEATPASK